MRKFVLLTIGFFLLASLALAIEIPTRVFCDNSGVWLTASAAGPKTVSMQPGQTLSVPKVSHPDVLSRYGLADTTVGDQILVTYQGDKMFKLKHTRTNREVAIQATWLP